VKRTDTTTLQTIEINKHNKAGATDPSTLPSPVCVNVFLFTT
jgi:hypothetical protein